jgi:hypothetical protein
MGGNMLGPLASVKVSRLSTHRMGHVLP